MKNPTLTIRITLLMALIAVSTLACGLLTPTPTSPPPSPLPPTAAPTLPPEPPTGLPAEDIYIRRPGPNSRIVSSVLVEGIAGSTFEQNLVVTITDIDGAELAFQPTTIQVGIGQPGSFSLTLDFDLSAETPGRITVYDVSPRDGGLIHLASTPVTLLAIGGEDITAAPALNEVIDILEPAFMAEVSGGLLTVSGFSEYFFEANLSVMICGPGGGAEPHQICGSTYNILAEGYATIDSPDIGLPGSFSGELTYAVVEPVCARVVVYAISPMDGAIIHLTSREITLAP